MLQRVF